ncbi:MAG: Uma2 family endonuclease [Halothiobacillaceae bacterium]|nr:Uma2 family endonuclease [Halothiobacillaceae bacterium]
MAPQLAHKPCVTADEYLAFEQQSAEKHELINGEIYAMAGASDAHVTISGNIFAALKAHLRGNPCRSFIADMKLRVEATDAFFYPDVFVTCRDTFPARSDIKTDATLIVEVLSPSTEAYDRGAKFAHYRHLSGLAEYMLIDIETRSVDLYRKGADGLWVLHPYTQGDTVELTSVDLKLPINEVIFEDVE